jgi:hypothetical protein
MSDIKNRITEIVGTHPILGELIRIPVSQVINDKLKPVQFTGTKKDGTVAEWTMYLTDEEFKDLSFLGFERI